MKRFLTLLTIVFMLVGIANVNANQNDALSSSAKKADLQQNAKIEDNNVKAFDAQLEMTDPVLVHRFAYTGGGNDRLTHGTPFVYDPKTGVYAVVFCSINWISDDEYTTQPYIMISTDAGETWDSVGTYQDDYMSSHIPALAVVNADGSTNPDDLVYFLSSLVTFKEGSEWNNTYQGLLTTQSSLSGDFADNLNYYSGPDAAFDGFQDDAEDYYFGRLRYFDYQFDGKPYVCGIGQVFPKYTNTPGGYYGEFIWDVESIEPEHQMIPWDRSRFKTDLSGPDRSWNNYAAIDADANGNLYAAVNNIFTEDDEIEEYTRAPGVVKSTDNGATWGEFNKMPQETMNDYVDRNTNYTRYFTYGNYEQDAFVAYGNDEYSFFYRIGLTNAAEDSYEYQIVEVYYNGGTWGVRKVADLVSEYTVANVPWHATFPSTEAYQTQGYKLYSASDLGHELEAVKTTDGSAIIVKWVETTSLAALEKEETVAVLNYTDPNNPTETTSNIDTVAFCDVIATYRNTSESTWLDPQNVTDNAEFNFYATHLSKKVESINNIPMIFDYSSEPSETYQYGRNFCQLIIDFAPYTTFTTFSLGNVSVEENTDNYQFELYNAIPNPANDVVNISYNLDVPAYTKIELFNSLGQHVANLFEGSQQAGYHMTNDIDLTDLTAGAYYVKLTVGTQSLTKNLNIVK